MEDSAQGIGNDFWCCLVIALISAIVTFILLKRRHWWLQMIDAEESFWERLGIPRSKGGFRAFAESRFFAISIAIMTVVLFIMVAAVLVLHFVAMHQRLLMTNP
jgi:hypothetical protein